MTIPSPDDKHTQETKPEACPLCQSDEVWLYSCGNIRRVECQTCGLKIERLNDEQVVRSWNRRASPPPAAAPEIDAPVSCPFCDAEMRRATWHTSLWEGHKPECFLVASLLFDQNIPKWNHRASPSQPAAAPEIEASDLAELIERFDNAAQNYGAMQGEGSRSTIKAAQERYEAALLALTAASAAMEKKVDALDVLLAAEVARALEQAERHLDAKAFACHAHDDFGRGRERGVLEACVYLRSLIPAAPEKNDG